MRAFSVTVSAITSVVVASCGLIGVYQCWTMPGTQAALSVCAGAAVGSGIGHLYLILKGK